MIQKRQRPNPASFDWTINEDGSIHITDLQGPGRSVTNDVEGVLADITVELHNAGAAPLWGRKITYTDSEGMIDEIVVDSDSQFARFQVLEQRTGRRV